MNVSEVFIRRPIATALLMAAIFLFGLVGYELMPVAALPNVEFPTIVVGAQLPGASPTIMAETVATPLEDKFTQIPGLAQMTSTSGLGATSITLQFDLSVDINAAAGQVQQEINAASGLLPKAMPTPPTYRETNPANRPVLIYAVRSDAMPEYQLETYANTVLAESLSTVPGVGYVVIAGEQQPAVTVQINPGALASRGLSMAQVQTALTNATLDSAKGNLEGPQQQFTLDTNDQLFDASQFRNVIMAYQGGAPVTLSDVGDVINSSVNPRSGAWFDGKPAELLLIFRTADANTVQVVDQVKEKMPQLDQSIPPSVHVDLLSDRSQDIRASVQDVELTLLITAALVVLVIFAFLRKPWATITPSVTVPLAIVSTFGVMYLFGYSLDNLSLMALSIAIGFVVDDAIVMIENIVRYIEAGEPAFEAALKGAGQIGFTIISITLSLIAVFIPLLLMSGIIGRLFHEFAVTVTIAVVASAFIALTLTPTMCSLFLARERETPPGRINRTFERFFQWMLAGYDRGLNWVFRHEFPTLLSIIALIALTGYLYYVIPKGFIPEEDTGFLFGEIEARQDSSFATIAKMQEQISKIILKNPAVYGLVSFAGATGFNASENTARIFVQLKPLGQRQGIQQVMTRIPTSSIIGRRFSYRRSNR
jgi:multidrug efflux pump subunit AcrB